MARGEPQLDSKRHISRGKDQGIAVIAVRENKNRMRNKLEELPFAEGKLFMVENYLEAVGMMTAVKSGVSAGAVRRPLGETKVTQVQIKESSVVKKT